MTEPPRDSRTAGAQERDEQTLRHLFGTMICPRCGRQLQPCDHSLGIAWRCRKCGGQSLNFSQFRRMIPADGANAIWDSASARPHPPRRRTPCPECHIAMSAVLIPNNGQAAELDICLACQRLWLDPKEEEGGAPFGISLTPLPRQEPERPGLLSWFGGRGPSRSAEDNKDVPAGKRRRPSGHSLLSPVFIALFIFAALLLLLPFSPLNILTSDRTHYGPCLALLAILLAFHLGKQSRR